MVSLRQFTDRDAAVIREKQMPDASIEEISRMIRDWQSNRYQGKHFEMLALTTDDAVVGCISLCGHTDKIVSLGAEVFFDERGKGYAAEGMRAAIERAGMQGYRIIQDQVRTDNAASRALHEKLGFETDGYVYTNAKGRNVLIYLLCLP